MQIPGTSAETRKLERSLTIQSRIDSLNEAEKMLEAKRKSRDSSYENVRESLQANRDRITSPTPAEDDDEITPIVKHTPKKYQRKSPSVMWKHVTKVDLVIQCKYCTKEWTALSLHGSTSNQLKHLKQHHFNKISEQDKDELSRNGETSGNRGQPKRTLYRKEHETGPLPRNHRLVKQIDRKVARLFVSSTASWSLLENKVFGDLCGEMLGGRYNIPSRDYIQNNVMIPMFEETRVEIKKELKKHINIGLTTDAWTSMVQQSYITVTAHIINEQCQLVSYVLDTSEIIKRHTSENLMEHIHDVLKDYEIATEYNIVCSFNRFN